MLINEVESVVGLSKKSIRYYEENGLLSPKRNQENDYRIYGDEDILKLKRIKFLRELDVSIRELKMLNSCEFTLEECLKSRIEKIEMKEENYQKIKNMCMEIIRSGETYHCIDITRYFQGMNVLNKEGFTMRNVTTSKKRKIVECIISSVIFSLFFLFFIILFNYLQFTESEKMPWMLYWFLIILFLFPIFGIVYNLVARIKEINGGEEDEASKY